MRIDKVLNNNVAVTRDDAGREIVVMGRGLAFGGRPGDIVPPEKIEKTFTISEPGVADKFQKLIGSIPMAHMLLSERVINSARITLGKRLHDSIYVSLPDHISSAIQRYKEGIILKNPLLWDIRRFYKDEFEVGRKANAIVLEETGVAFLEDEAAFIAMHFVNAELGEQMSINAAYDITYVMQEICAIIRDFFGTTFDEDSLDYYRFITHLKFFAQRLTTGVHYEDDSEDLLTVIRVKYPNAFACARKVQDFVSGKYNFNLSSEELLYLTVHIARIARMADCDG